MTTLLIVLGIGVGALQTYLTFRGFGPPADLTQFEPDHRDQRIMLAPPDSVLDAYRRGAEATPGMQVVSVKNNHLVIDARPSVLVMDGDYGSTVCVSVQAAASGNGGEAAAVGEGPRTVVTVESMPKTAWVGRVALAGSAFVAKERALRMAAKRLGGINEEL
ncbi:hypothetical protein [Actinomyces respiraculi]|uniref:hypothetical protein n=1 Tax=Actinomyces respiraculi TaxID=2744574 RepID=UPI00141EBA13|nr:hypothetical protein [Actinomyces respiraculi]